MNPSLDLLHRRFQQQALWTKELRNHILHQDEISAFKKILEVGCGTGAILSTFNKPNHAFGIDIAIDSLLFANQAIDGAYPLACADGYHLPFKTGTFDIAYCHFLFLWLSTPDAALMEMCRVTKPGGKIIAFAEPDYGGRIDYPKDFENLARLQQLSLEDRGANTLIGRTLASLFSIANLKNVSHGVVNGYWDGSQTRENIDLEWDILKQDLKGKLEPLELERLHKFDLEKRRTGERVLYVPTFYAQGSNPFNV